MEFQEAVTVVENYRYLISNIFGRLQRMYFTTEWDPPFHQIWSDRGCCMFTTWRTSPASHLSLPTCWPPSSSYRSLGTSPVGPPGAWAYFVYIWLQILIIPVLIQSYALILHWILCFCTVHLNTLVGMIHRQWLRFNSLCTKISPCAFKNKHAG